MGGNRPWLIPVASELRTRCVEFTQASEDPKAPGGSSDRGPLELARSANLSPRLLAGRYRIVEPIGVGGMSVVWRAYDEILGRVVAVKVLAASYASDLIFRDRIRAEAKAAALLAHPNVTTVYDFGEEGGLDGPAEPFVVMELVDGVSLAAELVHGPLSWRTVLEVGAETAAALSAAHARGLLHRDITPANIMISSTGAKVVDFGISAVVGDRGGGPIVGTPAYLAPERLAGEVGGPAADVYALGVVLYQALTGTLPWPNLGEAASGAHQSQDYAHQSLAGPGFEGPGFEGPGFEGPGFEGHHQGELTRLPAIPGLPDEALVVIESCLARNPGARPPSATLARILAKAAGVRVAVVDPTEVADPATLTKAPHGHGEQSAGPPQSGQLGAGTHILASALRPDGPATQVAKEQPRKDERRGVPRRYAIPLSWAAFAAVVIAVLAAAAVAVALPSGGVATPAADGGTRRGVDAPVTSDVPASLPASGPSSVPASDRVGSGACAVRYTVRDEWNDGATVDLEIRNVSDTDITGWTLEFELVKGLKVGGAWNGRWSQLGATVTVEALSYNRVLQPGQALGASPGANLSGMGGRREPQQFRLNGKVCEDTT
jgi:serine/threonine protein kinase